MVRKWLSKLKCRDQEGSTVSRWKPRENVWQDFTVFNQDVRGRNKNGGGEGSFWPPQFSSLDPSAKSMKVAKKRATKVVHHTRDYWNTWDRGHEEIKKISEGFFSFVKVFGLKRYPRILLG